MKLEYNTGCMTYGLYIDGRSSAEMNAYQLGSIAVEIINSYTDKLDPAGLQNFIADAVERLGETTCKGRCDECGDTICTSILEI